MKPGVLGTLVGAVIGFSAAWSCSIDRPSDTLKCTVQADCGTGRICESGYCIVGTLPADARELVCPSTICNGGCDLATATCTITGTGSGNITCPDGWNCDISCPTAGACGMVNCINAGARGCDIDCTATDACSAITCNTKNCNVTCTGSASCGSVGCTTGDCTRTCTGSNACGSMTCTTGACIETCSGGSAACGSLSCGTGRCLATCQGVDPACGSVTCSTSCQCDVECDGTTNACPAAMICSPDAPGQDYCTETGAPTGRCDSDFANQCKSC